MRFSSLATIRMLRRSSSVVCLLFLVLLAPHTLPAAPAPTTERLQTLAKTITFDWAKSHPLTATFLGLSDEDGQLDTPSEAENARDLATIRGWESELASIPLDGASLVDVDDAKLLRAQLTSLERQYTVYKTYEKDPSGPSQAIIGAIYVQFMHLPIAGAPDLFGGPLTDAAKDQLPADRFAAFVKARDAALAAIEQTKKHIDEHA